MTDVHLIRRLDALLAIVALWAVLSLVVACFALMVVNPTLGVIALAVVVLTTTVAGYSFFGGRRTTPVDPQAE